MKSGSRSGVKQGMKDEVKDEVRDGRKSGKKWGNLFADMFGKKQVIPPIEYDAENWKPILRCSICNGEQVAGFKNIHTGEFKEECFIRDASQLQEFKQKYGITELGKEY